MPDLSIRIPERMITQYNGLRIRVRNDTESLNPPPHPDFMQALIELGKTHYDELLTLLKGKS